MQRPLSTTEVARILGLPEGRVRALVRAGWCQPARKGRRYAFSFQDLVVLRAARELIAQKVPAARIHRALTSLAAELPEDRPLSGLRIYADGRNVAVCDGDTHWQPETGQTLLSFDVDPLAERVEELRKAEVPSNNAADAGRRAFEQGLAYEGNDPAAARRAYLEALELDNSQVDAWVNLGRLAHELGDAREAVRLYHEALVRDPDDPVVHFNLALAMEDTSGAEPAMAHYRRALELDPEFADAHFNLAGLCEHCGLGADALRHFREYKRLTEG